MAAQTPGLYDDVTDYGHWRADSGWVSQERRPIEKLRTRAFALIDAVTLFQNNEYFTPQIEGYTLVGFVVRPTLGWQVHPKLALAAGLQALVYGGQDRAHHVWPTFSLVWDVTEHFNITMGTLPGVASHHLPEPVQEPEDQFTARPELGLQANIARPHLSGNLWVNWRQFIFLGDTIPEKFTAGVSLCFHPRGQRRVAYEMPLYAVFDHIGGQISNYPERMQSLANLGLEPALRVRVDGRFVRDVRVGLGAHLYHAMAGGDVRPFGDGRALRPAVTLRAKLFRAEVAYWAARNWYAPHGNFLFSSLSNYDTLSYTKRRSLLTAEAALCKNIARVARFTLQARAFFDTRDRHFDYAYGAAIALSMGYNRKGLGIRD